jgi:L-ribulose-5-phosphate 3-epimerase
MKNSKMGIFFWFGYSIEPELKMKLIREAGFDSVMLWWSDEYAGIDGKKEMLPSIARNHGLTVENIHCPFEKANLLWLAKPGSEELLQRYMNCIDACSTYEIPSAVIHLTNGDQPPPQSQIGLERLKMLTDHAEKKGINIALENLRRPDYLDFVFSNIQSDRLLFCYDSGHENCYTKGTDLLAKYLHKLCCLHLHDNDGSSDQHRIPGEGTMDWEHIQSLLNDSCYPGSLSLEVTNEFSILYKDKPAEEFLHIAYEKASKLLQ